MRRNDVIGDAIWRSDGTAGGTVPVRSFLGKGGQPAGPFQAIGPAGERFLFLVPGDGIRSWDLWVTDGTEAETSLLLGGAFHNVPGAELYAGGGVFSGQRQAKPWGDRLLFRANDLVHGSELWISDGTQAGTSLIADLVPGEGGSDPEWLTLADEKLFFTALNAQHGRELWFLDLPGVSSPPLFHRGDPNTSGTIDISDGIYLLNWLFVGGPEPAAPGPTGVPCGFDPDPPGSPGDLGCESYSNC